MKQITNGIMKLILVIALPITLLLTTVQWAAFDLDYFESKYKQYDIMERTGIEQQNLMDITEALLEYLEGERESIVISTEVHGKTEQVFEKRELLHLYDVRVLFQRGYFIRNVMGVLSLITLAYFLYFQPKSLSNLAMISGFIPTVLIGILSLLMLSDFYKYFTYFHEILFTNDLWLLNPKTDILIQMYPLQFFNGIAFKIALYFGIELLILILIGIIGKKRRIHM